jgi:hypothetical protein
MTPTHYLLSADDVAKLREALSINRVMAKDDQGNYTKEITPKVITEALAILQSAQGIGVVAWESDKWVWVNPLSIPVEHVNRARPLYAPIQGDSNEG